MKNIYLNPMYLAAMQREIYHRLQSEFLYFSTPEDTTYHNDECGSFEFTVNNKEYKIYTPSQLGDEIYSLFLFDTLVIECSTLTSIFESINETNNKPI